jgi:putative phosphoesterase
VTVALDAGATVAVVADTHGRPHPGLAAWLARERPGVILHAGDVGELAVLDALRAAAPVVAVRGNIDARAPGMPDDAVVDLAWAGRPPLRVLLVHVGLAGRRLRADVRRRAAEEGARLVVCGHSHVPLLARDGDAVVFNPGSAGPRRFALPVVFGRLDPGPGGAVPGHVDAASGGPWRPPVAPAR